MRQISVKQAEKWLERLKGENGNSYKELSKALKKYEKTDDEYECHMRMSHLLLQTPLLAKEANVYMEEGNRFIVNETEEEKITKLMAYVKANRFDKFREILAMIQDMSTQNREANVFMSPEQTNKNLIACLRKIIQGEKELEDITNKALQTGEQQIASQDLEHLKVNHHPQAKQDDNEEDEGSHVVSRQTAPKLAKPPAQKRNRDQLAMQEYAQRQQIKPPQKLIALMPMNPNDQKKVMKHIEKTFGQGVYESIVKLMHLYHMCVITRNEIIDMIEFIESQDEFQCLRDIIQSRENGRRKTGAFRPLSDNDFSLTERASLSYVAIPSSYPIRCAYRTEELKKVLNDKWISVPYGSEETFNVRNKNVFETTLLKGEDQRYEFDLYTNKLSKAVQLLEKAIQFIERNDELECEKSKELIDRVVGMGVVQMVYRNASREQKEELEWHLKSHQLNTCSLLRDRINSQLRELRVIKDVHAIKNWTETAAKNFVKSLDLKSFQFKKGEKEKMKGTSFVAELNDRLKILENGGQQKLFSIPFEDKKSFFSIFNSFECSSKTQHCLHRKLPEVKDYDMKEYRNKTVLPALIFAFEDDEACAVVYSLVLFFIDSSISSEGERTRCKTFLELVLVRFLGWKPAVKRCLSTEFDEDKFHIKVVSISNPNATPVRESGIEEQDLSRWVYSEDEPTLSAEVNAQEEADYQRKALRFNTIEKDTGYEFQYLPAKEEECKILYASENFYIFLRFLYALYERIVRMREVAESEEKSLLFCILFYSCIKTREGVKFQENLGLLFGKQSYLFSTIYKLFENLAKSISVAAVCPITSESLRLTRCIQSEELYLLLMNRYSLQNSLTNNRMVRLNFSTCTKALYLNSLYSYYKCEELRDQIKKRLDISKNIEIYALATLGPTDNKNRKPSEMQEENGIQYLFDSTTYKMTTYGQREDLFVYAGKPISHGKALKRDLKRVMKVNARLN